MDSGYGTNIEGPWDEVMKVQTALVVVWGGRLT